jgi:hypothetical protein
VIFRPSENPSNLRVAVLFIGYLIISKQPLSFHGSQIVWQRAGLRPFAAKAATQTIPIVFSAAIDP